VTPSPFALAFFYSAVINHHQSVKKREKVSRKRRSRIVL